ncbi:GAF domain-containing protein [Myxococcota bacterium]|nr:GAF domain-containing protein [Myxococcota bacterium]
MVVTAADWMDALGLALERYGLERATLERAVCLLKGDGSVDVADPDSASRFVVRQVEADDGALDPPSLVSAQLAGADATLDAPSPEGLRAAGHRGNLDAAGLDRLARALADLPAEGSPAQRAAAVLDLLLREVPAESASVLVQDDAQRRIHFLAARGPAAVALTGVTVPAGKGIVGVVIRTGTSLLVNEPDRSGGHYAAVDTTSGYRTRTLLACPIQVRARAIGALELLNPFGRGSFTEGHRRAAELAARRLGALLG